MDGRVKRAHELYERAVFGGDQEAVEVGLRELDAVDADLAAESDGPTPDEADAALARGKLMHARFLEDRKDDPRELELFERAANLFREFDDVRGEAEALFWTGTYHQVVRDDSARALEGLEPSYRLAAQTGDKLTMSYAVRHLGFAALIAGDRELGGARLRESLRLREEIGFTAGIAAALLALAQWTAEGGNQAEAESLLDRAEATARTAGAAGTLRWIEAARREF